MNTYNSTFATQTLLCALPPAGSGPGLVNYAITSITQNADGVHADIVMANPTPVNSIGWKIQILVNGSPFGGSRPGDPGGGVEIGTYYVAGFTDNTHFQVPMNPVPSGSPLVLTSNIPNADIYSSPGTVPFATAYTAYPQTLRMTSAGNLVLGEAWYNQMLREINLQTRTIRRIGDEPPFGGCYCRPNFRLARYGRCRCHWSSRRYSYVQNEWGHVGGSLVARWRLFRHLPE